MCQKFADFMTEEWIEVASGPSGFELEFFIQAMELFIHEPNIISPAILRAEIVSDTVENDRIVIRRLIPRQKTKDSVVYQRIRIEKDFRVVRHEAITFGDNNGERDINLSTLAKPDCLPYFYPKFKAFRYVWDEDQVKIEVLPFESMQEQTTDSRMIKIWQRILAFILKIGNGFKNGYKKRVHHDIAVPKVEYQDLYEQLKEKYRHWVDLWCEETDPSKHVFEDISIATWLILLWKHSPSSSKKIKFVDLGCGNGFLTYILTNEGYSGYGIDISKRKLWDLYSEETKFYERPIQPDVETFPDVEWIIGNHPDELTMWIPIISAKSDADSKFVIIPCCFHDLSGSRSLKFDPKLGRYQSYCEMIENHAKRLGFEIEREYLRIPSTKNICLFSRSRSNLLSLQSIEDTYKNVTVAIRKSDREKTIKYLTKKLDRGLI